jgi:hypothetical protein
MGFDVVRCHVCKDVYVDSYNKESSEKNMVGQGMVGKLVNEKTFSGE